MPLSELQAVLARILTDEPARRRFLDVGRDGPIPSELDGYGLSLPEWLQLRAIPRDRLELYAQLLRNKRLEKLAEMLPWTWFLLGKDRSRLVGLYTRDHLPTTIRKLEEAESFCTYLHENASLVNPPYVPEVARYEITLARLVLRPYVPPSQSCIPELESMEWRDLPAVSCIRTENATLLDFDYDLELILSFAQRSEHPPELLPCQTTVLFCTRRDGGAPRSYGLQAAAVELLSLCDGRRSLRDIVRESVSRNSPGANGDDETLRNACISVLNKFLSDGVIELCHTETNNSLRQR